MAGCQPSIPTWCWRGWGDVHTSLESPPPAPVFQRGSGSLLYDINFQGNVNVNSFSSSRAPLQEQKAPGEGRGSGGEL